MAVETHVDHARTRVDAEREALAAKADAVDRFVERVAEAPTTDAGLAAGPIGAGGTRSLATPATADGCRAVRRAFDETVRSHSVADVSEAEPLLATIRAELSEAIAAALAPDSPASLTPTLARSIRAEAAARRLEIRVTIRALDREATELETAAGAVDDVTDWLVRTDDRPLSDCGFDALRERHETLAAFRSRLDRLAVDRQGFLAGTTSHDADVAVSHRSLLRYCYRDFPVDHPVLATVVSLARSCADCQQAVRAHLVRRA